MAAAKTSNVVMALMMIAGLMQSASAATHTVDWTFGTSATQFDDLASGWNLKVGDVIKFVYDSAVHNVYEVSKADLESCTSTSPIKKYESDNATITLTRSGYYGFICEFAGHCGSGNMKMSVQVAAAAATPSASPPSVAPAASPPSTSVAPASSSAPPRSSTPTQGIPEGPSAAAGPAPIDQGAASGLKLQLGSVMFVGALVALLV